MEDRTEALNKIIAMTIPFNELLFCVRLWAKCSTRDDMSLGSALLSSVHPQLPGEDGIVNPVYQRSYSQ